MPVAHVLVILPQLGGDDDAVGRIFLTVDDALLESGDGFGPVHIDRVGAKSAEGFNEKRAADNADLHALEVFGLGDGALVGGQFTEAVFSPADDVDALLFNGIDHHFAGLACEDGVHSLVGLGLHANKEGQAGKVEFLDLGRPVDGGTESEVDGSLTEHHEFIGLLAGKELAGGVDLDVDAAVGTFADQVGKVEGTLGPAGSGTGDDAQFVLLLVLGCHGRRRDGRGTEQNSKSFTHSGEQPVHGIVSS